MRGVKLDISDTISHRKHLRATEWRLGENRGSVGRSALRNNFHCFGGRTEWWATHMTNVLSQCLESILAPVKSVGRSTVSRSLSSTIHSWAGTSATGYLFHGLRFLESRSPRLKCKFSRSYNIISQVSFCKPWPVKRAWICIALRHPPGSGRKSTWLSAVHMVLEGLGICNLALSNCNRCNNVEMPPDLYFLISKPFILLILHLPLRLSRVWMIR